ncbi:MAG: SEC59/DGK1/VTE5 family protein [Melioribacteraceae bacterium]|nr:SEC59/DGK1/VTE5 family protein [Melioribacteraceae bacterium]MCF8393308.1 SEC59/DGK1/VTE5 family protein [Melioribacteraceae bacterium]MCF8419160.1 SEC59/DGK1/VTE5 family protein [Melioribacteraceae bacterium]
MTPTDNGSIDYKNELLRKAIHLCSLSIPVIYYFLTRELALTVLIPLAVLSLVLDLSRYFFPPFSKFFYMFFGFMLRDHEKNDKKKTLNGATYVLISAALGVYFFPKVIFITAFATLIVGDIAAALIGRKFGKHKFLFKSLEGTLSFFVSACVVVFIAPKIEGNITEYLIGIIAVAVGAIAENVSYGWADDNLTIPISIGVTMWVLYTVMMPNIPIILENVPM